MTSTAPVRAPVEEIGPPDPAALAFERRLRRWLPKVAAQWRMTPRGIRMLQRVSEPNPRRVRTKAGTVVSPTMVGGVRGEWVRGVRARNRRTDDQPVVLYCHGGGYVFGSPRTHRVLASQLSHATGLPLLLPDYRLPPEATLPAPIEDTLAVYRALLDDHDPARIVIAGDSAGGNLAHNVALHAAEAGLPTPAGLVLLSPWSDLSMSGASFHENDGLDAFIPQIALRRCARVACGGLDPAGWRQSPLFAPDELQARMPPTLVQVGSTELVRDDGLRVADVLARNGVDARVELFDRIPHVQAMWGNLAAGRDATRRIGAFVADVLPDGTVHRPDRDDAARAATDDTTVEAGRLGDRGGAGDGPRAADDDLVRP
ncbi:MAG: alpha/beta hydrolase [Solirubrobacteraceae bacterium]|nr:alpha/beta hydrolase [Solirubrobacteraceae bacterium]